MMAGRFMPVTLTGRFMVLTLAIAALSVVIIGSLSYSHNILDARKAAKGAAVDRILTVIDATETAATTRSLSRFILSTAAQPAISAIVVIAPDGQVALSSRRAWQDRALEAIPGIPLAEWFEVGKEATGVHAFWDEGFARAVAVAPLDPVNPASRLVESLAGGQVVLSMDANGYVDTAWSSVWFDVFWMSGLLLVTMALLTGILQWRVVSALEALYHRARGQSVAADHPSALRDSTPLEVKTLGRAIDELEQTRTALNAEKQRLSNIADTIPGVVYEYRHFEEGGDVFTHISAGILPLLGSDPGTVNTDLVDYANRELWPRILPTDLDRVIEATQRANEGVPTEWQAEFRIQTDRGIRWLSGHAMPVDDDEPGQLFRGVLLDITARKTLEERLERAATSDPLTGALNRAGITPQLDRLISAAHRQQDALSVVMFDVDRFKSVNDTYGHALGDLALQRVVALAKDRLRGSDSLARWGGEEFLILLPATRLDGAVGVAEAIRREIGQADFPHARPLTISAGAAELASDEDVDGLLQRVDNRLYQAKAQGRDRVVGR